jgi:phenylacetate-coenzyme A ligase PaaK-like adenylate-forming protein
MLTDDELNIPPYSLSRDEKRVFLTQHLSDLTRQHYEHCAEYKKILDAISFDVNNISDYSQIPFLPVRLFKEYELKSVLTESVVKTLTSSGTTGQKVSKIFLDKPTSATQTKVLTKIVSSFLGKQRVPMLILDTSAVIKNRAMFSARGAGILGFSMFGTDRLYALDDEMNLNIDAIKTFLEKHQGETIFLFGFTFMIWQHFYKELKKLGVKLDLSKGVLIHGGGWKKLVNEAVKPADFKKALHDVCGIMPENVHDYYGMVEQTGSIYVECECGHLHTSIFSDIICRRSKDFSECDFGEEGLIEVVSVLPESYPGHVLLTEDVGVVLGEDDCPCGRKGKYFKINGRIAKAEIRGCSDTYAAEATNATRV